MSNLVHRSPKLGLTVGEIWAAVKQARLAWLDREKERTKKMCDHPTKDEWQPEQGALDGGKWTSPSWYSFRRRRQVYSSGSWMSSSTARPSTLTVALQGGTHKEGFVFINNIPVCDYQWSDSEAEVVCKHLR